MSDVTNPCRMSVAALKIAFEKRELSPVEVAKIFLDRIVELDQGLHAYVEVTRELALAQAAASEKKYAAGGDVGLLEGVPVSVKDAFHVAGVPSRVGSLVYANYVAKNDSGVVRRLRASGAVFPGKTNVPEFCQSATTDNRLGPETTNPWNMAHTPGGSSGGAAASVAAGLATLAVGSDGGGSIRIPGAFTGLYGIKPTVGLCADEKGFRGMTGFVCPGPLANRVMDARIMLDVLAPGAKYRKRSATGRLRVAYCARPERRPVDAQVSREVEKAARALESMGHGVTPIDIELSGWAKIFGPLVLEDEYRERGHLLDLCPDKLSRYEVTSLEAARVLTAETVLQAELEHVAYKKKINEIFNRYDLLVTPTTAVPAFRLGERPQVIAGESVSWLWGAFPFTVPFNVAGVPAATLPCGLADGLPVGVQLVTRGGAEQLLLDVSEDLEDALAFDRSALDQRWKLI